ncbi:MULTISPECIES: 50S ribosomal protein L23 [Sorangium]|jgi:large subunit ribosomal protein L23|uniref:Large ribosomal subunit protein uL23 n=2 Tax=Sorangium cellulosum TaxID=56 RepID=A0A150PIS0_SORCE|nr:MULTISPECIES: 50S ribosomal protein L23 [Sorangium]HTN90234.1 50S ribosomal protein L23 [Sorangium sp.]AGP32136.1 50S ribosomal protein L23 [Sorangium cellulosum So0157-2]AUX29191.1 50S ribosomal protein L23 [Sorangium cellulosum]KYF55599.1 50S ribosomal protein L23 [Sorangium cellulosum]KYF65413.1 50S ribosomal protein L23 [Sorangium cellulosum]
MQPEQIIRRPIILTEKSSRLRDQGNKVIFEVRREANKIQIKDAIQTLFKVGVVDVNTMIMRGKEKRMGRGYAKLRNWKKAIVTLKEGDEIQFFDEKAE